MTKKTTSKKAMETFQGFFLKLAETQPNTPLTSAAKTHVRHRLSRLFSQHKVPDHPPYSLMIEKAIKELNEKGGSTEDSISKFILEQYRDLPLAHWTLLKHHLVKRCESGDIAMTPSKRYMVVRANPSLKKNHRQQQHNQQYSFSSDETTRNNNIGINVAPPPQQQENISPFGDDNDSVAIDWINDLIQAPEIGIQEHVTMDLDELENLPNEDLFEIITNIDTLDPSHQHNASVVVQGLSTEVMHKSNERQQTADSTIGVRKDEESAESSLHHRHYSRDVKFDQLKPDCGTNNGGATSADQLVTQATKRGRGRPRKHEKKEQTVKRPRGRPPKRPASQDQDHDHGVMINSSSSLL